MLKRLWYNESGFKGNCEKGSKEVLLGIFQRGIRMIKKVVIVLMFCLLLCGCTPAVKYKIEGANVNVQSIYFQDPDITLVTAVVQQEWLGGDNYVYIKKLTDEEVPDTELKIIWIEVEKDRWDECGFDPYVYE